MHLLQMESIIVSFSVLYYSKSIEELDILVNTNPVKLHPSEAIDETDALKWKMEKNFREEPEEEGRAVDVHYKNVKI